MKTAIGFVIGLVTGAIVALMVAPSSGEELRAKLSTGANANLEKLQTQWQRSSQEIKAKIGHSSDDEYVSIEESTDLEMPVVE